MINIRVKELCKEDSTIQGVIINHKTDDGYQFQWEYDSKGNHIHTKNSNGFEYWYEYDSEGNEIYYKDSDGYEMWWDSKGNRIEDPNKVQEFTLEEIAEKFGIDVKNLRIKD